MFLKTEFFSRCSRIGLWTSGLWLSAALLAACGGVPSFKTAPEAAPRTAAPLPSATTPGDAGFCAPSASTAPADASEPALRVLAYSDRVRTMSAAELSQEVTRLNHAAAPADQLQLALVLSQLRQLPELIRAQEQLTRLLANTSPEAQALHPLARLLAARYGEQRRLEDLLERQNQQTREIQRRLEQTNERLEALKAIERSLTSRSPAPAAAPPASRPQAPAP